MFTGIIEDIGTIKALDKGRDSVQLKLGSGLPYDEFKIGDSLAVNGVCLTLTEIAEGLLSVDLSHETLAATTLKDLKPGSKVHLERALAFGGRLGGHLVTGHIDGVGEVVSRAPKGPNLDLELLAPAEVVLYLIPKGSVAVDGVSLTVNDPKGQRFQVTLVPHTLEQTTLSGRRPGDKVNLEADLLGKYVKHLVSGGSKKGIDEEFLAQHGFLGKDPAKP